MRVAFRAAEVGVATDEFAVVCAFAGTDDDGHPHTLTFQRDADETSSEFLWGVYLEFDGQQNGDYGSVARCALTRTRLSVTLSGPLGDLRGVAGFDLDLAVDEDRLREAADALNAVFSQTDGVLTVDLLRGSS